MHRTAVVRHACAGRKGSWSGPDDERPLDPAGVEQAEALADLWSRDEQPPAGLRSSPTRRCIQTLEPLASRDGLEIAADDRLCPGRPLDQLVDLLTSPALA